MMAGNVARYNSLNDYLTECRSKEANKKRLADKLFHTARAGLADEIRHVVVQCVKAGVDLSGGKHDYLLEYFDSFHTGTKKPDIDVVRLIFHYQKTITHKAKLSFYQNIYYRRLLDEETTTEFSDLLNSCRDTPE